MPKITVIIPVYNKEKYIARTIQSVLNQSFRDFILLIIDNDSTDGSTKIIHEFAENDSRIRIITTHPNIGPSGAYRLGMSKVETEYLCLIDADDYVETSYLNDLYNAAEKYNADITLSRNDMVGDGPTHQLKYKGPEELYLNNGDIKKLLPQILVNGSDAFGFAYQVPEVGVSWQHLYRTSFLRKNHLEYNTEIWIFCDWEFNLRAISMANSFVYINKTNYHYVQDPHSVVHEQNFTITKWQRFQSALKYIFAFCQDENMETLWVAYYRFAWELMLSTFSYYLNAYGSSVTYDMVVRLIEEYHTMPETKVVFNHVKSLLLQGKRQRIVFNVIKNGYVMEYIYAKRLYSMLKNIVGNKDK